MCRLFVTVGAVNNPNKGLEKLNLNQLNVNFGTGVEVINIPRFQMKSFDQLLQLTIHVSIIRHCWCSKQSKQRLRETKLKPVECQFWYRCGFLYTVNTGALSWGKLEGEGGLDVDNPLASDTCIKNK